MKKAAYLLSLVEADPNFLRNAIEPLKKQMAKDGIRVQQSGNTVTLNNPRTGKKVTLKDNGRQVAAKKVQNNRPNGPEEKSRGSAGDIQREVDWMKVK